MRKIIIWALMFLLLIGIVNAVVDSDITDYIVHGYKFDDGTADDMQTVDSQDGVLDSVTFSTGVIGGSAVFNAATDDVSFTAQLLAQKYNQSHSVVFWLKNDNLGSSRCVFAQSSSQANGIQYRMAADVTNYPGTKIYNEAVTWGSAYCGQGDWCLWTFQYTNGSKRVWGNTTINVNATQAWGGWGNNNTRFGEPGGGDLTAFGFIGEIDELFVINKTLTGEEIAYIWNGGAGRNLTIAAAPPSAVGGNLSINWTYPLNNTQYNIGSLDFNFSVNVTNASANWPVNCSLYQNDVVNSSVNNITSELFNTVVLYYDSVTQAAFNYSIVCYGAGSVNNTIANRSIFIDNVYPSIITNFVNSSSIFVGNLTGQFNFSDSYLYKFNISIDGVTVGNKSNMVSDFYSYNLSVGNFSVGVHTISVKISDGHTDNEIIDYYWTRDKDMALVYHFEDDWVKVLPKYTKDFPSWFDTTKEKDRYVFEYRRHELEKLMYGEDLSFRVSSSRPITISARKDYPGWLVIDDLNKWIDFATTTDVDSYEVTRINDNTIDVLVKGVKDDEVLFHSIGDLNTVTQNYSFYQGNYTFSWTTPILEESSSDFIINFTINSSYITDINANITYNGTVYSPTKTNTSGLIQFTRSIIAPSISAEVNLSFNWTYSINGFNNYSGITTTNKQQIYPMGLINCSANSPFLLYNISVYDETNLTLLNADFEAIFDYWYNTPDNTTNVTFDLSGKSNYYICRLNNYSFYVDAYIRNIVNFTHRYYLVNDTVDFGSFKNIYLYNFQESAGISDLKGTVRYAQTYNYYPNIIAKLQRFYPTQNVWKTVQMDKTGDFGLIFFNIIEENTDYKIVFQDTLNHILKTTEPMKFVCTANICDLTFLLDPYAAESINTNVSVNWSFRNNTNIIAVDWIEEDATETTIRTFVRKNTMTGSINVCDTTQTGTSGYVNCNVSAYSGEVFLSVSEGTNTEYLISEWISLESTSLGDVVGTAESVLWTFGVLLIVIMFGMFSPIGAVISGIVGLIFIYYLGVFSPITVPFLIVAIVLGVIIGIKVRS